jgi:ribonuclease R
MPRKNARKREKAIRAAMGSLRRKKNPALAAAEKKPNKRPAASKPTVLRAYSSDESPSTITGIFSYSGKGYGFCQPDEEFVRQGIGDVFIPPRQTKGAMTGDRVTVSAEHTGLRDDGTNGYEGEVLTVEPAASSLIGTLRSFGGDWWVEPDSKRWGVTVSVPRKDAEVSGASDGWKVEVVPSGGPYFARERVSSFRGRSFGAPSCEVEGRIASVFGDGLTRDANYAAILTGCGIRTSFPESVLAAADASASAPVDPSSDPERRDLRGKVIFTIDGAGAKDLDDAISLEKKDGGWILGVHIADVSHYVRPDSPPEKEAVLRGTSVYFTDKVVPMLPESLSNGACSLNAGADRYAMTAEVTLDASGVRTGTRIFRSLIRSRVRGVYSEVNDLLEKGADSPFAEKYAEVLPTLSDMAELYRILRDRAKREGSLELEDAEAVILLDENGNPCDVVRAERGDGERLIEQFMLQANMGVAETMHALGLPCLYRVHARPDDDKLRAFAVFASGVGLDTRGIVTEKDESSGRKTDGKDRELPANELIRRLSAILSDAEERGMGPMISVMLLRSMMKAKYQAVPARHFGLGAELYCHFTSPIRRYPDPFVHSVLTAVFERTGCGELTAQSEVNPNTAADFAKVAAERAFTSSDCEVRAMDAERDIENLYLTLYMARHIGEEFHAAVSGVTKNGMFVRCDNLAEGFVPADCWPGARTDEEHMTLTAKGRTWTLGSPMDVILTEADPGTRRITFAPKQSDPA